MIYSIMNCLNFQGFEILHSTIVGLLKTFTTNIGTLSSLKSYQEHLLVLIFARLSIKLKMSLVSERQYVQKLWLNDTK